jgi:hypothetical protein
LGGYGSGKGSRYRAWRSKKQKTDSLPGLTIPELMKMHKAKPGSAFTFSDVQLTVGEAAVTIEKMDGSEFHTPLIKIAAVPCNYGGVRYFGHCPICQKRVRTLYLRTTLFACRHCFKLGYWSQYHSLHYRLILQRRRAGVKINNDEWTKPQGMRKKTFKRLRSEFFDLEEMAQIAEMFSCRSKRHVKRIFKKCGMAVIAGEILGLDYNWNRKAFQADL